MFFAGRVKKLDEVKRLAKEIQQREGKPVLEQYIDIATLLRINPTCNPFDYYDYGLYKRERGGIVYRRSIGGVMFDKLNHCLNKRPDVSVAWDKLLFDIFCNAYEVPCAQTLGFYLPDGSIPNHIPYKLSNIDQLQEFLSEATTPLFAKPAMSRTGYGAFLIKDYCSETQRVQTNDGNFISFDDFLKETINLSETSTYDKSRGYLFQQFVTQHSDITEFTGTEAPSGIRVVFLNDKDTPKVHRAHWKITSPGNITDNFSEGKSGNLITQIDPIDGSSSTAIDAMLPHGQYHAHHPLTNKKFTDFKIPHWDKVITEVERVSRAVGEMKIQYWDILIGPDGPLFLELNDEGGVQAFQLHGNPFMDDDFIAFMNKNATLKPFPKLKKLLK